MLKLNDFEIKPTMFPDGTSQVWKLPTELFAFPVAKVEWEFSCESEFLQLAQLKYLLDVSGSSFSKLYISYLPYARQDKFADNDSTFALYPFARLLNSLAFNEITILDPHSEKAIRSIANSYAVYPKEMVRKAIKVTDSKMLCFPDKGAAGKYGSMYPDFDTLVGSKARHQGSGRIETYDITGNSPEDENVMIVDDICDGGATFLILAEQLASAKAINLFVTHGIFSKGLRPLLDAGIKRIFTAKGEAVYIDKLTVGYKSI